MTKRVHLWCGLTAAALSIGLLAGGCPPRPVEEGDPDLRRFASEQEFLDFFKQQAVARNRNVGGLFRGWGLAAAAPTAGNQALEDAAAGGAGGESGSYSTTNLQEAGVDESDVIKSDGTNFYIARGQTVRIVRGVPADSLAQVGQIDFEDRVDSMYLVGSSLIVLAQRFGADGPQPGGAETLMWPPYYLRSSVAIHQVDVSDPANPAKTGEIELDGSLVSSRVTGGQLIVVLTIMPELPERPTPINIAAMTVDQVLPRVRRHGAEAAMLSWADYYRPGSGDGYCTTAVVTLDATDIEQELGKVAIMADAGTIYSSTEALYTTDTSYDYSSNERETTTIHKFAYRAQAGAEYIGSGRVPGRLLNQFSLGELDGYLRVATHVQNFRFFGFGGIDFEDAIAVSTAPVDTATAQERDVTGPYNAVYVLGEGEAELTVVGSIEDIAPGERLYSARFMGQRGYLVTFRQIDPLFVLDLADPTAPAILGQLKIPGYSDYLHPFGDNLLIGVGRAVGQTQWGFDEPRGVQFSLFDVSDPTDPTAIEQIELGGFNSSTDVSNTHKAFTFRPEDGLLALPARLTPTELGWEDYEYGYEFDGVVCYRVSDAGFEELGRVAAVVADETQEPWLWWCDGYGWRRAAFIDDTVYALSEDGVRSAPLSDFEATTPLQLTDAE